MATDTGKQCTITNKSGKDFLLTIAVPPDEMANNGGAINSTRQLEVLKTTDGKTIIANNSSGTLILDYSYKSGGGQTGYVKDYELVAGDTNWLYPLATLDVAQTGSNGTSEFPTLTVDGSSATAIAQAAKFYQAISAYAESQLITDYTTALESTKTAKTADEIAAIMNAFFKSTNDYQDVTLAEMSAVHDYYNNFPAVWAQFKDDLTYYLYGSDGKAASFQGILNLEKSGPLDPLKPAGGYTCSFTPASNPTDTGARDVDATKQVAVNYADGMFVTDKTAGQASVTLKGNFLLKSFFTNQDKDDSILLVLSGNVNGIICAGFDRPQASAKSTPSPAALMSAEEFWDMLIHPKSQLEIGISLVTFCGAVALLGVIMRAVYAIYKAATATNSAPNVTGAMSEQINKANGMAQDLAGKDVQVQPYIIRDCRHAAQLSKDTLRRGQMVEAFERQKWAARAMLELTPEVLGSDAVRALEQCLTDGRESTQKLNKASFDDLRETINRELPKLNIVQGQLLTLDMATRDKLSDSRAAEVNRNLDTSDALIKGVNDAISREEKEELETGFEFVDEHPY